MLNEKAIQMKKILSDKFFLRVFSKTVIEKKNSIFWKNGWGIRHKVEQKH